jgi:transposase InsO family protein
VLCRAAHNTYIATWAGWLYLATVIDCFNKEVIGYAMADHMRTSLICDALDMAARNHRLAVNCIFHSDRGTQYQCRLVNDSEALPQDIRRVASW